MNVDNSSQVYNLLPASAVNNLLAVIARSLLAVCALVLLFRMTIKRSGIPGPLCLPVIGSVHVLGHNLTQSFARLRRRYGDVFRLQLGATPVIVLNGLDVIRDATSKPEFAGRPGLFTFRLASAGLSMTFTNYSETWRMHRRVAERALKMGVDAIDFMRGRVLKEAQLLMSELAKVTDNAINPSDRLFWSLAHVQYSLCYGDSRKDPDFKRLVALTMDLINDRGSYILNFLPFSRCLLRGTVTNVKDLCSNILGTTKRKERQHMSSYKSGTIRDVLDALIELSENKAVADRLSKEQVLHTVHEYLGAGLDVTHATLCWALLYLVSFPDIQKQLQDEVDNILNGREPEEADRIHMPLLDAFILETLRHSSPVPFALPHCTIEDTTFRDILIPKETFVMINLYSITRDENLFSKPDIFNPWRFIDDNGQVIPFAREMFCPFGTGKRRCVGETLVIGQLFVYLASLVQSFKLDRPSTVVKYDLSPIPGVMHKPKSYEVVLKRR